jgi:transposase
MTYSVDFRKKVLAIREKEKLSYQKTAQRFGIGTSTVIAWCKRLTPKKYHLKQPKKVDLEKLAQDVKDYPDAYQYERAERFGVKQNTICYALGRLGVTYKKNLSTSKSQCRTTLYLPKTNTKLSR